MLWKAEAMLGAQCLSNPLPCWEDRSVRGSVLRHRKCLAKRETRYKICKLALKRHMLQTGTHTQSLSFSLYFPAQGSYSQMTSRVSGSATCSLFGRQIIFSCCKSFTRVSCHANPQRCQYGKTQTSLNLEEGCERELKCEKRPR